MNTTEQDTSLEQQTLFIGDDDYLSYGGMWIKSRDNYFDVYMVNPEGLDTGAYVGSCSVHESDLEDREALLGMDIDSEDEPLIKAYGLISYWGIEHWGGTLHLASSKSEVKKFLRQNNLK